MPGLVLPRVTVTKLNVFGARQRFGLRMLEVCYTCMDVIYILCVYMPGLPGLVFPRVSGAKLILIGGIYTYMYTHTHIYIYIFIYIYIYKNGQRAQRTTATKALQT